MKKFAQGKFTLKNPEKYIGSKDPIYRSGWEIAVMKMCDENPAIEQWASEPVRIPYRDPLTGKQTVYVPDFLVMFMEEVEEGLIYPLLVHKLVVVVQLVIE